MKLHGIKKLSDSKFEAYNLWSPHPGGRAFGGHIISKALEAALSDSESIIPNSLSVYFHRPVLISEKLCFEVETLREGKSLLTKRIVGYQNNELMVTIEASFALSNNEDRVLIYQKRISGLESITNFVNMKEIIKMGQREHIECFGPFFDLFEVEIAQTDDKKRVVRVRIKAGYSDTPMKYSLLAFISDLFLIESSLIHLNLNFFSEKLTFLASVDHKIFFNSAAFTETIILVSECVSIGGSKVLCMGQIYDENLELLATTIQEGMLKYNK